MSGLGVEDALQYLRLVKMEFQHKPHIYNEFLDVMKDFKAQQIDVPETIRSVSNLFEGNKRLILGFNVFLPEGYKIELPVDFWPSPAVAAVAASAASGNRERSRKRVVGKDPLGAVGKDWEFPDIGSVGDSNGNNHRHLKRKHPHWSKLEKDNSTLEENSNEKRVVQMSFAALQHAKECHERYRLFLDKNPYRDLQEAQRANKEIALAATFWDGEELRFAPKELRNDKEVVLVACLGTCYALKYASKELQNDRDLVMAACNHDGNILRCASEQLKNDKELILKACSNLGEDFVDVPLRYASEKLQNDKEVVMVACMKTGYALEYASQQLKNDKDLVLKTCCCEDGDGGIPLQFASDQLRNNKEVVLKVCAQDGIALQYASKKLRNDKEVVLVACSRNGLALEYALHELKKNKEVVLEACYQDWRALKFASDELRDDKEVVLKACSQNSFALQYASPELKNDKEVVLMACSQSGIALEYASQKLKNDKEVVLRACSKHGDALRFASEMLRGDKEVVMAAAASKPESLKYASGGLNQDRDCLIKAKLWDADHVDRQTKKMEDENWLRLGKKKIVLSTRFSLSAESSPHATKFAVELKNHPCIAGGNFGASFVVYSPNAFNKGTCDPNWTDRKWPCRGTFHSCQKPHLKMGVPQEAECCWRYSFRYHLGEAAQLDGFMIQVVDLDSQNQHTLGDGQSIETEMAQDVGIKVFRFLEPPHSRAYSEEVDQLVSEIQEWYRNGCKAC